MTKTIPRSRSLTGLGSPCVLGMTVVMPRGTVGQHGAHRGRVAGSGHDGPEQLRRHVGGHLGGPPLPRAVDTLCLLVRPRGPCESPGNRTPSLWGQWPRHPEVELEFLYSGARTPLLRL